MNPVEVFCWAVFGSAFFEATAILRYFVRGRIPQRYRRIAFWCVRIVVAVFAGVFAIALNPNNELQAVIFGAIAPMLLENATKNYGPETD